MDWYNKARYNKSIMRATILTTYDCNFACEYCVEEGVKKQVKMDEAGCRRTMDWLINRVEEYQSDNIWLHFYGGEPLINLSLIKRCVTYVREDRGLDDVQFALTINGSLLAGEAAELLASEQFSVLVSLDGPASVHEEGHHFCL